MNSKLPSRAHLFCPHLGRRSDPNSAIDHPSPRNYCYRSQNLAGPALSHQQNYCLKKRYTQCPVYFQPGKNPFPNQLRHGPPIAKSLVGTGSLDPPAGRIYPKMNRYLLALF